MSQPLTPLEQRVYHYLIDFLAANTYQPSIREIAREFRIKSTKTVSDVLHGLERKGYIERDESRSRGVRLLGFPAAGQTQPVPCYSQLRAGGSVPHPEDRQAFITVDRRFLPGDDVYFLTTSADGPPNRGILAGDRIMVSPSLRPRDGDVIVTRGANGGIRATRYDANGAPVNPLIGVVCGVFRASFEAPALPTVPAADAPVS
jgi:repressor LexA